MQVSRHVAQRDHAPRSVRAIDRMNFLRLASASRLTLTSMEVA